MATCACQIRSGILLAVCLLVVPGCEKKEKVLDVKVGGPEQIHITGEKSKDGQLEIKVDQKKR